MRKIPTALVRDENDRRHVTDQITPGCEWVFVGEGVATRKYDGTCVMYDGLVWYARREVKAGKQPPPEFVAEEHDETTGKTVGWEPIEQSPFAKMHVEALGPLTNFGALIGMQVPTGTYELIGPKINGNPEGVEHHRLQSHANAEQFGDVPTDVDALMGYVGALQAEGIEGIVWHHPDGRMAKLKAKDIPRTPSCEADR